MNHDTIRPTGASNVRLLASKPEGPRLTERDLDQHRKAMHGPLRLAAAPLPVPAQRALGPCLTLHRISTVGRPADACNDEQAPCATAPSQQRRAHQAQAQTEVDAAAQAASTRLAALRQRAHDDAAVSGLPRGAPGFWIAACGAALGLLGSVWGIWP